jgi:hypothetical protein
VALGDPMHEPLISGGVVRRLWVGETELYRQHLLRLDAGSRRNRFGGAVSDEFIKRYAEPSAPRRRGHLRFFCRWDRTRCRGAAPARTSGRSRGGAKHRAGVAEPRRGNGVARTCAARGAQQKIERLHMLCPADNRRMQQLARKFDAELSFQSGSVVGEMKAPRPTSISMMRELVDDSIGLATAMLDVRTQLAKRLEHSNGSLERRPRERRYERLMLVDNWR